MCKTLREIAEFLGGSFSGDGDLPIRDIKSIDDAGEGDLTFIANPKYRKKLHATKASAVLVVPGTVAKQNLLFVKDPYSALARVLDLFHPPEKIRPGKSKAAFIAKGAKVSKDSLVMPHAYVGRGSFIGRRTIIHPGCYIAENVRIGDDCIINANVSIYKGCLIGNRVILHAGVVIGSDGFGFANPGQENLKIPQVGIVQIDDDVEIGANSAIDRGTLGKTWIQRGAKIDNLVQIAHNVVVGEKSVIVAQVGVSGSTKIGRGVMIGGQAGLVGHIGIDDFAMIAAQSGVTKDVEKGRIVSGSPHMPHREWLRLQATLPRMPALNQTVISLQKRIEELEKKLKEQ